MLELLKLELLELLRDKLLELLELLRDKLLELMELEEE